MTREEIKLGIGIAIVLAIAFVLLKTGPETRKTAENETFTQTATNTPTATKKPTERPTGTPTPDLIPTSTPTEAPTEAPTQVPTEMPTKAPTKKPTAIPTQNAVYPQKKKVDAGHTFKPYTRHTAYNVKSSQQYKLQQAAVTDEETGIRIVQDPNGEWRYCVALGTYWAGGHPEHIGRCIDVYMKNGAVLKCVLGDVKRQEHTKLQQNKYGIGNNDVLEFIVDDKKISAKVKNSGNVSNAGTIFAGDADFMLIHNLWIEGFGKEKK